MKKTLKLFMAIALAVFMTLETVPVNTVFADEPVVETTDQTAEQSAEPAGSDQDQGTTPAVQTDGTDNVQNSDSVTPEAPVEEEKQNDPAPSALPDDQQADSDDTVTPPADQDNTGNEGEAPEAVPAETEEQPKADPIVQEGEYNDVLVHVSYDPDTFETEVTLRLSDPGEEEIKALKAAYGDDYKAVDISFIDGEGKERQPLEGKSVNVTLTAKGMEEAEDYKAIHVDAEGEITELTAKDKPTTSNPDTVTEKVEVWGEVPAVDTKTETVWVPAVMGTRTVEETEEVLVPAVIGTREVEKTREVEVPAVMGTREVEKTRTVAKTRQVEVPAAKKWYNPFSWFKAPTYKTETYYETETYTVPELYTISEAHTEIETYYETEEYVVTPEHFETRVTGSHEESYVITEGYFKEVKTEVETTEPGIVGYEEIEVPVQDVEMTFEATGFSVYAVVPNGEGGEHARLTINFYNGSTLRETFYVKNGDDAEDIAKIISDPGVGTLATGQIFRGWTDDPNYTADTTPKTIANIRTEIGALTTADSIKEGDVKNYYAMIFQIYNIAFQDEYGATVKTDKLYFRADGETPSYKITEDYVPDDPNKKFKGWYATGTVTPAQETYPVNTTVTIGSDVVFSANAPTGAWLSFNENGRGASYTAPQFIGSGDVTVRPADPTRRGYTFGGWYENAECTGNAFTFGSGLNARKDLYAKWTPNPTAPYTVIIWKQLASDDKNAADADKNYSVWEVVTGLTGNSGSTINTVTQNGANVNTGFTNPAQSRNIRVDGREFAQDGFHCDRYDQNVTIAPEGNTVLNVYYDRNLITLRFNTATSGTYYNYYFNVGNGRVRTATMSGLFDAEIDFTWPSVCYRNTTTQTANNAMWTHGQNIGGTLTFYGSYKLSLPEQVSETLTLTTAGNSMVYFYRQNEDGSWPNENGATNAVATSGGSFTLRNKYAGFSLYKYKSGAFVQADNNQWSNASVNGTVSFSNNRLNIRFSRNKYRITYLDGTYFDGNGVVLQAATKEELKQTDPIFYEADISSYGQEDNDNYYVPTPKLPNYVFSGWYLDETCTHPVTFNKMPEDGVTVYAKWVQAQYRVFLHPNIPTTQSIEWGQTNQQMNFRVTAGEKISGGNVINGTRENGAYELIGWFTDPSLSNSSYFNFDTVLNDTTVPTNPAYNKTTDYTDNMDKWGNITGGYTNSDVSRPWITRKLDLYAKWREIIVGAKGINVEYDPADGYGAPNDTLDYLDNTQSIAQAASKPNDTTMQFKGWVLMHWDGEKYVEKDGTIINPGDPFTVLKADAKKQPRLDDEGQQIIIDGEPQFLYTVQLKAVYEKYEASTPSHITWYGNGGTLKTAPTKPEGVKYDIVNGTTTTCFANLKINEKISIVEAAAFERPGYKFLGWARIDETQAQYNEEEGKAVESEFTPQDLTEDDLWLIYNEDENSFTLNEAGNAYTGTTITEVAPDEDEPFHALYAVWEPGQYYVYYTGSAKLYAYNTADTVDLQKDLTDGMLYAGYTTAFGGYTVTEDDAKAASASTDGYYQIDTNANKTAVYNPAKTYVSGVKKWFVSMATTDYTTLEPEAGTVYYVKEVPESYLTTRIQFIYDMYNDNKIQQIYLMTVVDDKLYEEVGFDLEISNEGHKTAKLVGSFTFEQAYSGGVKVTTKPQDFGVTRGWVGYVDGGFPTDGGYIAANTQFKITPCWTTKDGIKVSGTDRTFTTGASGSLDTMDEVTE